VQAIRAVRSVDIPDVRCERRVCLSPYRASRGDAMPPAVPVSVAPWWEYGRRVQTVEGQEVVERQKVRGSRPARFVLDVAGVFPPPGRTPTLSCTLACCHARSSARWSPTGRGAGRYPVSWLLAMAQRGRTATTLPETGQPPHGPPSGPDGQGRRRAQHNRRDA
jgi:hypothetical protein